MGVEGGPSFNTEEKKFTPEVLKPLHRGVWAEALSDSQELPVGGSVFNQELATKLELDFEAFEEELQNFTAENINVAYGKSKSQVEDWLKKVGSDIDPYTYFVCLQVQQKMQKLLEFNPSAPANSFERHQAYTKKGMPKLSELRGKTECAEQAALGQYLMQKVGLESAYVSGITMQDVNNDDEFPEDHSFLVLSHLGGANKTLLFDIARPRSEHNVPRILEPDAPFTYDLLRDKDELLVGATEVLQGGRLWYGVGEPLAGQHKTVENI